MSSSSVVKVPSVFTQFEEIKKSVEAGYCSKEEGELMRKNVVNSTALKASTDEDSDGLTKHFKEMELRNFQPWRRDVQRFNNIVEEWEKVTLSRISRTSSWRRLRRAR